MATAKTPDFMKTVTDAMSELQSKAKETFEKSTAYAGEMTDFAKGNVEALVESGKVFAAGMQDMGKTVVDEAKSAYETMTADMKEMAAIKSPAELFQLQGKLVRRNFETMVAYSSKAGEFGHEALQRSVRADFGPREPGRREGLEGRLSLALPPLVLSPLPRAAKKAGRTVLPSGPFSFAQIAPASRVNSSCGDPTLPFHQSIRYLRTDADESPFSPGRPGCRARGRQRHARRWR